MLDSLAQLFIFTFPQLFNITGRSKDAKTPKEDKATAKKDKSKATALAKKEKTEEKMVTTLTSTFNLGFY